MERSAATQGIDIFISHSSADVELASALIDLLRSAIQNLDPRRIRCSGVPGYRLPGGAKTDDQLRRELLEARVFIGLLTRESLQSTYVLFELGARWGIERQLTPLVAAGMGMGELKPPLKGLNAHSCAMESHLHQLVREIGSELELAVNDPPVYEPQLKKLVQSSETSATSQVGAPESKIVAEEQLKQLDDTEKTLLKQLLLVGSMTEGHAAAYMHLIGCTEIREFLAPIDRKTNLLLRDFVGRYEINPTFKDILQQMPGKC